jgi:hypothetical protein
MKIKITLLTSLFLIGCGISSGGGGNKNKTPHNNLNCIDVYTLGRVVNAVVTDNSGKTATYDTNTSKYCFNGKITYPITVKSLPSTYIDVDYDNNETANDIKPNFTELKSYFNYVDLITTMHANAVENNLSVEAKNATQKEINSSAENNYTVPSLSEVISYYVKNIKDEYDINITTPSINEKILNFVAYDYEVNNNKLPILNNDLFSDFNNLKLFFDNELNKPSIADKIKYYSFYHSLELLDKKLIQRVDTIHKPSITYLHSSNLPIMQNIKASYYNVIANDIKVNYNGIYVASGFDGVTKFFNIPSSITLSGNIKFNDTFSNAYNLDLFSFYDANNSIKNNYLFVADGAEGVKVINITGGSFIPLNAIMWKYYDEVSDKNISITIDDTKANQLKQIDDTISVKTYISPLENKMWLAFGTKGKGLYLVDLKKVLSKIKSSNYPIIIYNKNNDVNNTLWITGDGGTVYSEAFSSNGENLYATKGNTIEKYDLSSITSISSPINTNIKADNAYNLKMITKNGIDELFVSTDKGIETYDVLNNGNLNFTSQYTTEGAQTGYYPKMAYIDNKNILLVTDGYKGIKAIKYDSSYQPKLCGVGYFSYYGDNTKAAKVTSLAAYYNINDNTYYVIAGVEGYGLLKFKLDDLLFKHCQ